MLAIRSRGGGILGAVEGSGRPAAMARFSAFLAFVASLAESFTGSSPAASWSASTVVGIGVDVRVSGNATSAGRTSDGATSFSCKSAGAGGREGEAVAMGGGGDGDMNFCALRRAALDVGGDGVGEAEDIILGADLGGMGAGPGR